MSTADFGSLTLVLFVLITLAHILGYISVKLRQPRVLGEIMAGVLLGPSILGHFVPELAANLSNTHISPGNSSEQHAPILGFLYNLGLLLLMFASGAETRGLFHPEDTRQVAWLASVGTGLPFILALVLAPLFPLHLLMGGANQSTALLLVVGIAMAVTSIPVISKILHDLRILHTRFARLILGVAVAEDVVLWVVLAVATAVARSGKFPHHEIVLHVSATLLYFALGLVAAPPLLKRLSSSRLNVLAANSPIAYVMAVLLAYAALAALLHVSLVFAAFLAGIAVMKDQRLKEAVETINKISCAIFVPVYFAIVGYQLDLSKTFSLGMLIAFLFLACAIKLISAGLGARLAGFPPRDSFNLAITLNARGGPGIVLASVAFEAAIINARFYTTLVLVAVLTSAMAGAWLDYLLRTSQPLLSGEKCEPTDSSSKEPLAA